MSGFGSNLSSAGRRTYRSFSRFLASGWSGGVATNHPILAIRQTAHLRLEKTLRTVGHPASPPSWVAISMPMYRGPWLIRNDGKRRPGTQVQNARGRRPRTLPRPVAAGRGNLRRGCRADWTIPPSVRCGWLAGQARAPNVATATTENTHGVAWTPGTAAG